MGLILLPLALIAYFLAIFLAGIGSLNRSEATQRGSTALLGAAWVLQFAAIVERGISRAHFPLTSAGEYLLAFGWVVLGFHLVLSLRSRIQATGLVLPPLAFLATLFSLVTQADQVSLPEGQQKGWFIFHTTIATLGMAALGVAFAMSLIYLAMDRVLKSKKTPRLVELLPSLDTCDRLGYHALLLGFPLLTLGIATGSVWSESVHHRYWIGGAKQTFPLLAWAVFAVVLYARLARGYRGRKSAYLTIAGFALGLLTVLGMGR